MTTVTDTHGVPLPEADQVPALVAMGMTEAEARFLRALETGAITGDVIGRKRRDNQLLGQLADASDYADLGGPGSGNWGHAGRPGKIGGSAPRAGGGGEKVVHGSRANRPTYGAGNAWEAEENANNADLTEAERHALTDWGLTGYRRINEYMRLGGVPKHWNTTKEELDTQIADIKTACDKLPVWEGEVYRGLHFGTAEEYKSTLDELTSALNNGLPVVFPAFTSSSLEKESAAWFARAVATRGILLNIKSRTGVVMGATTFQSGEHEVMFMPGARFRVTGIKDARGESSQSPDLTIFLEELAPTATSSNERTKLHRKS